MKMWELIERFAQEAEEPTTEAQRHFEAFGRVVTEALKAGEEIKITGLGKFSVKERKAREGRNPQTGQSSHHLIRALGASLHELCNVVTPAIPIALLRLTAGSSPLETQGKLDIPLQELQPAHLLGEAHPPKLQPPDGDSRRHRVPPPSHPSVVRRGL